MVPAGASSGTCRSRRCMKKIYWVKLGRAGRMHPVDCDVPGGEAPSAATKDPAQTGLFDDPGMVESAHDGRGVSHFATCPDAGHFRGDH